MVMMKVEIYEKEYVRPNTPTPNSLRNYKLSLVDQAAGTFYTPFVFFYGASNYCPHDYEELKKSLSKTLSILYPLAGRIGDGMTLECNDEGAEFVVAEVRGCDLGDIIGHPKLELLWRLLPRDPSPMAFDPAQPMLAVQVNRFRCGGTALALCIWHAVADAAAIIGFLQTWAAINRGEEVSGQSSIADPTSIATIFPPANFNLSETIISTRAAQGRPEYCTKRFVFTVEEIERLRNNDEYRNSCEGGLTRVEDLLTLVWTAVIRATLKANPNLKQYVLKTVVNLRHKMNPPFPSTCQGNIHHMPDTQWNEIDRVGIQAGLLVGRVREAIRKVTDDYIKKLYANGYRLKALMATIEQNATSNDEVNFLDTSSICKFPFLDVDFGWGKRIWMGLAHDMVNLAIFMDSANGGVEVWIWLSPLVMRNLDKDNEFLAYVSFS